MPDSAMVAQSCMIDGAVRKCRLDVTQLGSTTAQRVERLVQDARCCTGAVDASAGLNLVTIPTLGARRSCIGAQLRPRINVQLCKTAGRRRVELS